MPIARVTFQRIELDSLNYQSFDPNDDHMISKLFFTLEVGSQRYDEMYVEVNQPYGTTYETEPLEVSKYIGSYDGNWDHNEFKDMVEQYYRRVMGHQGKMIKTSNEAKEFRPRNIIIQLSPETFEFKIPDSG